LISDLKESWAASRSAKMTETADQHTDPEVQQQSASFIEPDDFDDKDSTYQSSLGDASYTTSITSSAMNYTYENGRRYHSYHEGEYVLPNDEQEQDRLDLSHHIYRMLLNGELHRAPIKNPGRVLDIGTGTGIWAIDFADEHPESDVIGNDLSPIQFSWY
jgi:2-polyprenyl-3-methyl-5-hydroxy-6-metoxy-1,4-benzoquinol methylase